MILILKSNIDADSREYKRLEAHLNSLSGIKTRVHKVEGAQKTITEIYLIGNTSALSLDEMKSLPAVGHVIRVSEEYRVLGRHKDDNRATGFSYQGLTFSQDSLHVFPGLCAVDTPAHVEATFRALKSLENFSLCNVFCGAR